MLEIKNISKQFGTFDAVRDVSIVVPDGAFLVLLGPSGCGKTTLLRMLAGLELPNAGQIVFGDKVVSDGNEKWTIDPGKRNSGLVFQSYALWPHMSVRGNIEWPLKVAGHSKSERAERVNEVLELLDIRALAERYPNEVSGGQQQRVAIARTIAPKPAVMLFDEPLSNLDARLRVEMRSELMRLHRATGATTVYVTHDQIEAMTMATHIAVMNEGRIEQFGQPLELSQNPETAFVATFVGTPPNNMVATKRAAEGALIEGKVMPLHPPVEIAMAMFKAEDLVVSPAETPTSLAMELVEASAIAGRTMVTGIGKQLRLTAIVDAMPDNQIGDIVHMELPTEPTCWFTPDGRRAG